VVLGTTISPGGIRLIPNECGGGWVPWHGVIDLDGRANYDEWFKEYSNFVQKYARLAAENGASIFSFGNELGSLADTRRLTNDVTITDFMNNLEFEIFSGDQKMREYGAHFVEHLLDFDPDLKLTGTPQTSIQKFFEPIIDRYKKPRDLREEIKTWVKTRRGHTISGALSSEARDALIGLENERRAYLFGKWLDLIQGVRQSIREIGHRPLLTYNVNFDAVSQVEFWQFLDFISISAYFPLADRDEFGAPIALPNITTETLKAQYKKALKGIGPFLETVPGHPRAVFSEIGFTNRRYTTLHPWAFSGCDELVLPGQKKPTRTDNRGQPYDNDERTHAIEALNSLVNDGSLDWLNGVFVWNAYTDDNPETGDDFTVFSSSKSTGNNHFEDAIKKLFIDTGVK
jgi:hypothetical protein